MKPFVVNRHGKLVFPTTVLGELDPSVLATLEQFTAVIDRDLEAEAPTGTHPTFPIGAIPRARGFADAVRDGAITRPVRVFAPGVGAGAVGGYAVLRFDPAIVAPEQVRAVDPPAIRRTSGPTTSDDVRVAFGE